MRTDDAGAEGMKKCVYKYHFQFPSDAKVDAIKSEIANDGILTLQAPIRGKESVRDGAKEIPVQRN